MSTEPVIITTSGAAPAGLVTEEEYAAREAGRPPGPPAQNTGTTVVRTEAELTAALEKGGDILVPGVTLRVCKRVVPKVRGTRLRGNGAGNSRIEMADSTDDDRVIYPVAADCTVSDLTISGGPWCVVGVNMDGGSRGADRFTLLRCHIESVSWGILLSGGPATQAAEILEDFQFLNCRITDFTRGGIYMSWEMLRPRFQDFYICGKGMESDFNGMWLGLGVVDGHILNGVIEKVGRMGLEVYYAHGTVGGPSSALVAKLHPNGPGLSIDNIVVNDVGSMGMSLAGCKRCNIGALTVRNSHFIGVEFVDEDPGRSDYNITGPVSVTNHAGWAISIDQIKGGRFAGILVDTVTMLNGWQWGMQVYKSDDVTVEDSTFTNCGCRQILHNQSTRCHYLNNHFVAKKGENWPDPEGGNFAWYGYGGDVYFNGNVIRGNETNPLRTAHNNCVVATAPSAAPLTGYNPNWDDPDNYRGRQYKPVAVRSMPEPPGEPPQPPKVPKEYPPF